MYMYMYVHACTFVCDSALRQYMLNPETGKAARSRKKVVVADPQTVEVLVKDGWEDKLVAFCDSGNCTCNVHVYIYSHV